MKLSTVKFILLFVVQLLVWNYFNFLQYVFIVFLPVMLLCLPIERGSISLMLLAFVLGVAADFLVNGQLGLTALALVPVAALRRTVIQLVFGNEILARGEELSFHRQRYTKFATATLMLTSVFLLVYLWVDGAGMYSLGFLALKYVISLLVSTVVSVPVAYLLLEESTGKWN
jgi:cell shape-determining protein MreD